MANDGYDSPDHGSSDDSQAPPPEYYAGKEAQTDAENSLSMVLSVWWSFTWRFGLFFFVASLIIGLIIVAATGGDELAMERFGGVASLIAALPIGVWSMGKALTVKHKKHKIVFMRAQDEN